MGKYKSYKKLCRYIIIVAAIIGIIGALFVKERKNNPIILGFSAQLTGRQAELGVQERNGVQLAIEKVNESGGIKGRTISLIVHDDLGIPSEAQGGDKDLIKKGAVAIIGHATTSQTLAGLDVMNQNKIVMIGPTISTPKLSELDDYFFRMHPSFDKSSQNFAKYIYENRNIKNIAIIYDKDNLEYSKTYSDIFSGKFKSLGGEIKDTVGFSSDDTPDFSKIILKLRESNSEGLLIVASDMDTALIAQRARLMKWQIPLFASPWAQTKTLVSNGGQAVEGMELEQAYDLNNQSSDFLDFKSLYNARFGSDPSFGAAYSYESTMVIIEALKKTNGSKNGLKEALLEINNFKGLTDNVSFDKFGDVERSSYLSRISNGKFIRVEKLNSTNQEVNK